MSKIQNTIWLENAVDLFDEAVSEGDYNRADEIIKDVADQGFSSEATQLASEFVKVIHQDKLEDVKLDSYDA